MRFNGKLQEADLEDLRYLLRSKVYWPKLIATNLYGLLLLGALLWATLQGFRGKTQPNWTAMAIIWAVIFGLIGWSFYRAKKSMADEFLKMKAGLPDSLSFEDTGVRLQGPNGATGFQPWGNFKGWREGRRVVLLDMRGGGFLMFSLAEQSGAQRESIRQFISSRICSGLPSQGSTCVAR